MAMDSRNEQFHLELRRKYGDNIEIRTHEIRAHKTDAMVVEGYASVFDSVYNIGFDEVVDRGAFDNVLDDDVRFFFDHGGTPLARTKNGTLQLSVDDVGLHYRAQLSDTNAGRDLFAAIQRGDVSESSFAFTIDRESRDAKNVRHIESVAALWDVSAVSFPASGATNVSEARGNDAKQKNVPNLATKQTDMDFGKMTISDMRAKRGQLSDEFAALSAGIEAENRTATDHESEQLDNLESNIAKLDGFIQNRERQAKQAETAARMANMGTTSTSEARDIAKTNKRFSLSRAIAHVSNGRPLMGAELEWAMEAQDEARSSGLRMQGQIGVPQFAMESRAGTADAFEAGSGMGSGFVPTDVPGGIDALHVPSFIETLGVQYLRATGNIDMPKVTNRPIVTSSGAAYTEVESSGASTMELGEVSLTPKRYSAKTTYSKQLLLQGTPQVDDFIARQIIEAHNRQKDTTAFGVLTTAAAAKIADATANDLAYVDPAAPGQFDEDILRAMESALVTTDTDFANVQAVVGARALQRIRAFSATGTGGSAMYDGTSLMGYRVTKSGRVSETASLCTAILANFGQALIGAEFGPLDLLIDPYSSAGTAQVVLHSNMWHDVALRQEGACAISTVGTLAA
jgi:HK97 family phage prohead protease/HK97 family phage major capsid protein